MAGIPKRKQRSFDKDNGSKSIIGVLLGASIVFLFPFLLFEDQMRAIAVVVTAVVLILAFYVSFKKSNIFFRNFN